MSRPRAALLLVGHGSRVPAANRLLGDLARRLRRRFRGRIVAACFLEAARPGMNAAIETCIRRGASRILIVPYFLSAGGHVRRDLPRAAALAERNHPGVRVRLAPYLGMDARLVSLAADRARAGLRHAAWE